MTEHEIEAMKRNIEVQIKERREGIEAAAEWYREWKDRQPKGFRIKQKSA